MFSSYTAEEFVAEYRKVGVKIHNDSSGRDISFVSEVAGEGCHSKGCNNNREQHCACKILEIRVEIIEDIDGI